MANIPSVFVGFDLDDSGGSEVILGVTLRGAGASGSLEVFSDPLALVDNTTNPTVGGSQSFGMVFDGSTWDRLPGSSADGVTVNMAGNNDVINLGTFVVQEDGAALTALQKIDDPVQVLGTDTYTEATSSGMTIGAVRNDALDALAGTDNEFAPLQVNAVGALYTTIASSVALDVSAATVTVDGTGTFVVQTEIQTAAALTDTDSNPNTGTVGSALMGFDRVNTEWTRIAGLVDGEADGALNAGFLSFGSDGSNYFQLLTDATGALQVDILSGGGGPPAPAGEIMDFKQIVALAAQTPTDLDSSTADDKRLTKIDIFSSAPFYAELRTVDDGTPSTIKAVMGGPAHTGVQYLTPHQDWIALGGNAGLDAFRLNIENLDNNRAADVNVVFFYED